MVCFLSKREAKGVLQSSQILVAPLVVIVELLKSKNFVINFCVALLYELALFLNVMELVPLCFFALET